MSWKDIKIHNKSLKSNIMLTSDNISRVEAEYILW